MGIFNLFTNKKKLEEIDSHMIETLTNTSQESQRILQNVIKYIHEDYKIDIDIDNKNKDIYYFRLFSGILVVGAFFLLKRRIKNLTDYEMQEDLNIASGVAFLPFENIDFDREAVTQSTINLCNEVLKELSPNLKLIKSGKFQMNDNIISSLTSISNRSLFENFKNVNSEIDLERYNHFFHSNVYELLKLMNKIMNS